MYVWWFKMFKWKCKRMRSKWIGIEIYTLSSLAALLQLLLGATAGHALPEKREMVPCGADPWLWGKQGLPSTMVNCSSCTIRCFLYWPNTIFVQTPDLLIYLFSKYFLNACYLAGIILGYISDQNKDSCPPKAYFPIEGDRQWRMNITNKAILLYVRKWRV